MKVYKLYFSPTGGTKKVLDALAEGFDCRQADVDLTKPQDEISVNTFGKGDVCLVGVPSFGGRVPETASKRIARCQGGGAAAIPVCVYGNRAYEDTLAELQDVLEEAGFVVKGAVAAIAEHSIMHTYAAGRPDDSDRTELKNFGTQLWEALQNGKEGEKLQLPGNRPYKEKSKGAPMSPAANENCTGCKTCVKACPVGAIGEEAPYLANPDICIACMKCSAVCPAGARKLDDAKVAALTERLKEVCSQRKENELFLQ